MFVRFETSCTCNFVKIKLFRTNSDEKLSKFHKHFTEFRHIAEHEIMQNFRIFMVFGTLGVLNYLQTIADFEGPVGELLVTETDLQEIAGDTSRASARRSVSSGGRTSTLSTVWGGGD